MSNSLDDLYGDIYGEDEDIPAPAPPTPSSATLPAKATIVKHETHQLPQKPAPSSQTNSAPNLSYSAQIAQQFSTYQQTPSQERQQRSEMRPPAQTQQTSAIPTLASSTTTYKISSSEDTVFGKKPSEMHDAGKVFIGGLNWDTTDEGLRNYFSEFGKVDACTIMRDPSGTSRGFAFMTFEDPASLVAVLGREHILDGKAIDPKRAIPREEHLRNTRYFVGGLSPATTAESMKQFFSAYGNVVDCTIMSDKETGRNKGFGFVTFEDAANADQLVGKLGLTLDDKEIEVKMAQPRSQRDQGRMNGRDNNNNNNNAGFNDQNSRTPPQTLPFVSPQQQMSMMLQRQMGQVPMMGGVMGANGMAAPAMGPGAMPMMGMGMNPMAMMGMGMGMNGFNPMMGMGGMNMMGGGMGMAGMGGMNNMGMTGMRMGMGPIAGTGMGAMGGMRGGMMNPNLGRMAAMNTGGVGPARTNSRGQNNFHPYSR
ncbi:hnRNP A1-gamma isoform [Roridomyces roridus]|uniref:HnRNP A1-gamma isoform n=1 Tax=Roridomyces roridus TaxID=1738132 RepID=A0AAD7FTH6_9AGAR|nr:hnRNP A1-gamma isoform [Roridomyces roridus]